MLKRVIIVGSPRTKGRSAHLAEMLFEANIDERPEDELFLVPVSEIEVGPCIGCNACRELTEVTFKDDNGAEYTELRPRCVFDDDMQSLYDVLDDADELTVVSPIYFSGAPAPMKCVLDRMQPYFWANTRNAPKRPATLHVVGEGGDPHGHEPLVSEVKSALAVAGFRLQRVFDWVGKIDANGEITAEATETEVVWAKPAVMATPDDGAAGSSGAPVQKPRAKLDLYGNKNAQGGKQSSSQGKKGNQVGAKKGSQSGRGAQAKKGKRRG